ncbi:phosphoglucosamine mutase [Thermoproteota archaeon]
MNSKLFGTSGMRGIPNVDFTPELIMKLGLALANLTHGNRIAIGFDTRLTSSFMSCLLSAGMLAGGAEVRNFGLIPTPVLAFLTSNTNCRAGTMITASHNPPEYNGVKIFDGDGMAFSHTLEEKVEDLMGFNNLHRVDSTSIGNVKWINCVDRYVEMVKESLTLKREWSIVVDPGCGAAYSLGPSLFRELGCRVLTINAQPDGFFPGRPPEPTLESLHLLSKMVRETGANAGVAYDGDADRMALVDENGRFVSMDQLIASYGARLLSLKNKKRIVVPIDASMCIEESIEAVGGNVIRTAVGDVNVAESIVKNNAAFGAEASGAWISPDYSLCPDGILSSLLVISEISGQKGNPTLSKFVSLASRYPILRKKINCSKNLHSEVIEKLHSELFNLMPEKSDIQTIDGIRITSKKEWILVRPSGTEPVLRITVESKSTRKTESLMKEVIRIIENIVIKLP